MTDPSRLLFFEGRSFLALLAATLVYKMLTRSISLNGLLATGPDSGNVSPERVQLLLATIAMGAKYIGEAAHGSAYAMPDVDKNWLYMMGGSGGLYASVKALRAYLRKS